MPLPTTRFAAQGATSATHAAASSRQGRSAASKGTLGSPGVRAPGPASSSPFVYCPRPRRVALTSAFSLRKRGSWGKHSFPHATTERAGFEPATHLSARTRFPVALLRPLGHLSVLRSGEGGIRTLDGGIHPHNALAGRRLQPLGHFSASLRRIADCFPQNGCAGKASTQPRRVSDLRIPLRGEESTPRSTKMSLPAPPSYPRQSETRLRLPEAGFAFQGTTTP